MDNSPDATPAPSSPYKDEPADKRLEARDSLGANSGLDGGANDEVTPLLGNRGPPGDTGIGNEAAEWEGFSDFKGMSWWQRPSVSTQS